jgi:hypothetical protein
VLLTDGTVLVQDAGFQIGGNTAIYNSTSGHWRAGPVLPEIDGVTDLNIADGPASWEPNDKVLIMASPGFGDPPSMFFEWNGKQQTRGSWPATAAAARWGGSRDRASARALHWCEINLCPDS